jgi:hypothetical protein
MSLQSEQIHDKGVPSAGNEIGGILSNAPAKLVIPKMRKSSSVRIEARANTCAQCNSENL